MRHGPSRAIIEFLPLDLLCDNVIPLQAEIDSLGACTESLADVLTEFSSFLKKGPQMASTAPESIHKEFRGRVWQFGECSLDELRCELRVRDRVVEFEAKPLEVLRQLLIRAGDVVRKEELLDSVWPGVLVVDHSVPGPVAILPFQNESSNANLDYLRSALQDQVAATLSAARSLSIRPITSTSNYSDPRMDLRKVGRDLNVSRVVTGHYVLAGEQLQVTMEAVDTEENRVLWHGTVNVPANDLLLMIWTCSSRRFEPLPGSPRFAPRVSCVTRILWQIASRLTEWWSRNVEQVPWTSTITAHLSYALDSAVRLSGPGYAIASGERNMY
jgi:TolB-like protein